MPERIRALRHRLGLSLARFALLVGSAHHAVYRWEQGDSVPDPRHLAKIEQLEQGIDSPGQSDRREDQSRRSSKEEGK